MLDAVRGIRYNNTEERSPNIATEAMFVGLTAQGLREEESVSTELDFLRAEEYEERTDEEVAEEAKDGNDIALEYLINKYRNFVKAKARSYFLIGADREDIIQEGMIGYIRRSGTSGVTSFFISGFCRALHYSTDYYGH